jgi:hypothetical protein
MIRRWVESRGGFPATVKGTERGGEHAGLLRIDFPDYSGEGTLERISWEDFFDKFDQADIEFLFQEQTEDGSPSRFFKFVSRGGNRRNPR